MLRSETKYFGGQLENMVRDHMVTVQTRNHTAASRLEMRGECIVLTQEFREGDYCCKSAVAIGIGRSRARSLNETEVRLEAPPGHGADRQRGHLRPEGGCRAHPRCANSTPPRRRASPGSRRETAGLVARVLVARLRVPAQRRRRGAEFVEQNYHYFLYLMASQFARQVPAEVQRHALEYRRRPAHLGRAALVRQHELLLRSDLRQPTAWNCWTRCSTCTAACSRPAPTAARQQWGSQGIYIRETSYFNGLEKLPDDIAAEMQDLYLLRKPWEQRSERFKEFALNKHPHSSRWNWMQAGEWKNGRYVITERGSGPYGAVNHIFGSTAKIAYYFWRRYEFTQDRGVAAHARLPDAERRGRVLSQLSQREEGRRREISHPPRQQQRERLRRARYRRGSLGDARRHGGGAARGGRFCSVDADLQAKWREFLDEPDAACHER